MAEDERRTDQKAEGSSETSCDKKPKLDLDSFKGMADFIYNAKKINDVKSQLIEHLDCSIKKIAAASKYTILYLYDPVGSIIPYTADRIYNAIPKTKEQDILLIINSAGGQIEPAYLISKCCKEYSNRFVVSIPRKAKSAATLISVGADEVHMGIMSELGPIDPQIGGLPALGLSSAVEYLAGLCKSHPESSEMLAKYLSLTLNLQTLGYFERVSESAMQYAQRLLHEKKLPPDIDIYRAAATFVYTYKDHSFVIDKEEAKTILGDTIKEDSEEYEIGNIVHNFLERVSLFAGAFKHHTLSMVGTIDDLIFSEKRDS